MTEPHRQDGFAPIGSYAAIGDGRGVALVDNDGSIDWWPVPVIDSPPIFAAILDPEEGGRFELAPTVPFTVARRYRQDTAVLETTFQTESGSVTVVDSLNRRGHEPLPWTELARLVHAEGQVPMRWRIAPGRRFGFAEPWTQERRGVPIIRLGDQTLAVVAQAAGSPTLEQHAVSGEFTTDPDTPALLAVIATDNEPVLVPDADDIVQRISDTSEGWRQWRRRVRYDGPHADAVVRSALTLRLLTVVEQGANAAAATTSLPEVVGGKRNFDYRFCWVRDSSFALDSLTNLGLLEEVHASLSWLLQAVTRTAPDVHAFYTLDGRPAQAEEKKVQPYSGYLDSTPVLVGNSAASQRQLSAHGDLLDAVWRYVDHGGRLDGRTATMLAELAHHTCDLWRLPDAGLWELGDYQHYTNSRIGCWTALDRAVRLADCGEIPGWHADRWRAAREEIRTYIDTECWSDAHRAYMMYPGSDQLDAAVLLAGRTGFHEGSREKFRATVDAIRTELSAGGPLLFRYSSMRGKEGAFAACSFWLVEALAYTDRREEASQLFGEMLAHTNDVGLLSEEIDPSNGNLLGNFPQGLSHLALIGAAHAIGG